jgi:hypothetical protein
MNNLNELTNEQLRDLAAAHGKPLTAVQAKNLHAQQVEVEHRVRAEWKARKPEPEQITGIEKSLAQVPALVGLIADISDTVLAIARMLLIFSLPVVLALALYVESQRVFYGIRLFETHDSLALLGAWFLVIVNLLLELVGHYIEARENYRAERRVKGSLRIAWSRVGYWLGLGKNWKPQQLSPAQPIWNALRIVTLAILFLAVAGSMEAAIAGVDGNWREGMVTIGRDSSLQEMTTWFGGLLFAVAIVIVSQRLTGYVSERSVEFLSELERRHERASSESPALLQHDQDMKAAVAAERERLERDALMKRIGDAGLYPKEPVAVYQNGHS